MRGAALGLGAAMAAGGIPEARGQAAYRELGDILGGGFSDFTVEGLSADGSALVGSGTRQGKEVAFLWTPAGGMKPLVSQEYESQANGVSAGGTVVTGVRSRQGVTEAFRWTLQTGAVALGDGARFGTGVSADGTTIVGTMMSHGLDFGFRWKQATGVETLGALLGGDSSSAHGVNADGTVIVGQSDSAAGVQAFRLAPSGMVGLGDLAGGAFQSVADAVSADGSAVVGWSASARASQEAFRWTHAGGIRGLGLLPGSQTSRATGTSGDGRVVVGDCGVLGTEGLAFLWTPATGMVNLAEFLEASYGLDPGAGTVLNEVVGVSADGRVMVGHGTNAQSQREQWMVTLPAPPCPPPTPPTGVTASDGTVCGHVRVGWLASGNSDSFEVWRSAQPNGAGAVMLAVDNASPYFDSTGLAGATYWYFVRARGACNQVSAFAPGNAGYRITSVSTPTGVGASNGTLCDYVRVSWNAVPGATYRIWRNTTNSTTGAVQVGTDSASPFFDAPANRAGYWYFVQAVTACGASALSTGDLGHRAANPTPPTGVAASDGTIQDHVRVSWNAVNGASGYTIWRAKANSTSLAMQVGTKSSSPFFDTPQDDDTYFYWVRTTTPCGMGGFSLSDSGRRR